MWATRCRKLAFPRHTRSLPRYCTAARVPTVDYRRLLADSVAKYATVEYEKRDSVFYEVFERMKRGPTPSASELNSLISTMLDYQQVTAAFDMVKEFDALGWPIAKPLNYVLLAFSTLGNFGKGQRLLALFEQRGIQLHDRSALAFVMSYFMDGGCLIVKNPNGIINAINDFVSKGWITEDSRVHLLISAYCMGGMSDKAYAIFEGLDKRDVRVYNALLLWLLGNKSYTVATPVYEKAKELLQMMMDEGIEPNWHTFEVLIHGSNGATTEDYDAMSDLLHFFQLPDEICSMHECIQQRYFETAHGYALDAMPLSVHPKLLSCMILDYAERDSWPTVQFLLKLVTDGGCLVDANGREQLTGTLARANLLNEALLLKGDCRVGVTTILDIIKAMLKAHRYSEAQTLVTNEVPVSADLIQILASHCRIHPNQGDMLDLMKQLKPNADIIMSAMATCIKHHDVQTAQFLTVQCKELGIPPSPAMFDLVMDGYAEVLAGDQLEPLLISMSELGITPTKRSIAVWVDAYLNQNRPKDAENVLKMAQDHGVPSSMLPYDGLLEHYSDTNSPQIRSLFDRMKAAGATPTQHRIDILIQLPCDTINTAEAKDIIQSMGPPSPPVVAWMMGRLLDEKRFADANDMTSFLLQQGVVPNRSTWRMLFDAYRSQGMLTEAKGVINNLRKVGVSF